MKIMLMTSALLAATTSFAALVPVVAEPMDGAHFVPPVSSVVLPQSLGVGTVALWATTDASSDSAARLARPTATIAVALAEPLHGERAGWVPLKTGLLDASPLVLRPAIPEDQLRPAVAAEPASEPAAGSFTTVRLEDTILPVRGLAREETELRFAFSPHGAERRSPFEFAAYGALALGAYLGLVAWRRTRRRRWRLA